MSAIAKLVAHLSAGADPAWRVGLDDEDDASDAACFRADVVWALSTCGEWSRNPDVLRLILGDPVDARTGRLRTPRRRRAWLVSAALRRDSAGGARIMKTYALRSAYLVRLEADSVGYGWLSTPRAGEALRFTADPADRLEFPSRGTARRAAKRIRAGGTPVDLVQPLPRGLLR